MPGLPDAAGPPGRVERATPGRGQPRTRPTRCWPTRPAYCSAAHRRMLTGRGIKVVIPQRADQIAHRKRRGQRGGRPPALDANAYKGRNVVERSLQHRGHNAGWPTDTTNTPPSTGPRSSCSPHLTRLELSGDTGLLPRTQITLRIHHFPSPSDESVTHRLFRPTPITLCCGKSISPIRANLCQRTT